MFPSAKRTLLTLLRTPLIPPPPPAPTMELTTLTHSGPSRSRPRALSRGVSNLSIKSNYGYGYVARGYASEKGRMELYSDEGGSTGAGTDDVAHTDAAFNKDPNPKSASKDIENETGKSTQRSAANPDYSHPPGKQGEKGSEEPLRTSNSEAKKNE